MKKIGLSLLLALGWISFASAQDFIVTGTVTAADDNAPLPGVTIIEKGTSAGAVTDVNGAYKIVLAHPKKAILQFSFVGYETMEVEVKEQHQIDVQLQIEEEALEEVVVTGFGSAPSFEGRSLQKSERMYMSHSLSQPVQQNTDSYAEIQENRFHSPLSDPLSTFSIDVDNASYANLRRMINNGEKIPADAVRVEEMINYFNYNYEEPSGKHPFSVSTVMTACPWNEQHQLVKIGLKGKDIATDDLPASNLVFLLDVSGSMNAPNKLPLLKKSFKILVDQMREEDRVAIVVYAGAAGVVLPSTSGDQKTKIMDALNNLQAGGSTAGGAGIELAYKIAAENFADGGNNRIILATDGDFNVGTSNTSDLKKLIEGKRDSGIFLTCLGFGMGNYKDDNLEGLANKGNGNYAYIDNLQEANRVLGTAFAGTIFTIAKDVKIQVEFNPAKVQSYRLIGYENRMLNEEDFEDDKKDAGELGAGHRVTALYEVIPVGVKSKFAPDIPERKYQKTIVQAEDGSTNEMATVKLRYKKPDENESILLEQTVGSQMKKPSLSEDFQFASAVALFGMILRESEFANKADLDQVIELAEAGRGEDKEGYRAEFIRLVKAVK